MKYIIGLTGPTGSGKSIASKTLERLGMYVIDCDKVAHSVLSSSDCLPELISAFGEEILKPKGSVDRKKLSSLVFSNPDALEKLNQITLPPISRKITEMCEHSKNSYIVMDAPTLFESGLDSKCNSILVIMADPKIRLNRIQIRDHLSIEEAEARLYSQHEENFYTKKANIVLYNNETSEIFEKKVSHFFNYIVHLNNPVERTS